MADATLEASEIRALFDRGAMIKPKTAGGSGSVGDVVYIAADGDVEVTDANAAATVEGYGVVVETMDGETSFVAGDPVSVCFFGEVSGFSGLTPGAIYYVSATTGKLATPAPTGAGSWTYGMARATSATTLFILPGLRAAASNS